MVAKNFFRISLLILAFSFSSVFAAVYYVDAVNGNDSYNGTSPSSAWKSLNKVNAVKYNPGDQILFKRGNTWTGSLVPSSSGTSSARIVYGAYGTGRRPVITLIQIIPGTNVASNWVKYSSSVYYMKTSLALVNEGRIWLSGKEYEWSTSGPGGVNSVTRWCVSSGALYVYATSNPTTFYSSITYSGFGAARHALKLQDRDYLTFQNLDFRGGYHTIGFGGSDYNIIEDCNIGWGAWGRGIIGNTTSGMSASDPTSDYNIIRRDTIDSGWRVKTVVTLQNKENMDAISLQNGANHWEICENYFLDWDHSSVQMYGITASVNYNKVYKNYITAPHIAFARSFEIMGMQSNLAMYNEIYQNRVNIETARAQIGGYYTKIYYNIFSNMTNSITTYLDHKSAEGINIANFAGSVAYGLKIYNNTFYALDRTGIWSYVANTEFINNLIIDCGRQMSGLGIRTTGNGDENSVWKNNLIYSPGLSTSSYIVSWGSVGKTMSQFNALNGSAGCSISGNIQYTGTLTALVKNAQGSDFCPTTGGIAINKGLNVGLTQDFYGNPIVGNPDIGAVESGSSSTPVTNTAPVITSTPVTAIQAGQPYSYDVAASGNPVPTYSLKVFPSGMTINATTGLISWTPTAAGSYSVTVEANNGIVPAGAQSFTITVTSTGTVTQPSLPANIVSYWKLDEKTSGSYDDYVVNNNGTSTASPVPVAGKVGGAQQFNGTTSKIDVTSGSAFNIAVNGNFSVECWYKGSTIPSTFKCIVGRYIPETGARWYVGISPNDGYAYFYMQSGGSSVAVKGINITDGNWHHIAAARNGSLGTLKLYVDGVLRGSSTHTFTTGFTSSSASLNIGWFSFQSVFNLNGTLDEVAFYNAELSSADVSVHYKNGLSGLPYSASLTKTETDVPNGNNSTSGLSGKPEQFGLNQNYPNPFNPITRIRYAISEPSNVSVKVYDMLGKEIMTLVNQDQTAGYYEVNFDGSRLASGTYIYQLRTNNYVETKKMLLIK